MTRNGLTYYQADTDRFQDIKIKRLKKHYGCEGYAVFNYVQNEIYRVEGCFIYFDEDQAFDCAEYWNLTEERVIEIINFCADISLFDRTIWKQQGILTSAYIQAKYAEICRRAKKRIIIPETIALHKDDTKQLPAQQTQVKAEEKASIEKHIQTYNQVAEKPVSQISAEFRGTSQNSGGNFDKENKIKINPPSNSPQGGEPRKEDVQKILSDLMQKGNTSQRQTVPTTRRNTDGLLYYLEKYHIPMKEAEEILTLSGYGEIGHPIWALFQEIDRSRGKITMPGRFLLSRLRPS